MLYFQKWYSTQITLSKDVADFAQNNKTEGHKSNQITTEAKEIANNLKINLD